MIPILPRMTREQLALALTHIQNVRAWHEICQDVKAIQAGLEAHLHCPISVEEAVFAWERYSEDIMVSGWQAVDADSLGGCAFMIQAAYATAIVGRAEED